MSNVLFKSLRKMLPDLFLRSFSSLVYTAVHVKQGFIVSIDGATRVTAVSERAVIKATWQAVLEAKNQLPLVSVSPGYMVPPLWAVTSNSPRSSCPKGAVVQGSARGAVKTPNFVHLAQRCHWHLSLHLLKSWKRWQRLFLCVCEEGGTSVHNLSAPEQAQQRL